MEIRINDEKPQEVRKVYIDIGEKTFRITVNKFGELEINKRFNDDAMSILPSYANEIKII